MSRSGRFSSLRSLVGAGALGQIIGLLALPLITRLFAPESFGVLAVYAATIAIVAPIAAWRFDAGIAIVEKDNAANALLRLSMVCAAVTSVAVWLIGIAGHALLQLNNALFENALIVWLVPPGIFLASLATSFSFYASRFREFGAIARTRVLQPIVASVTQIATGFVGLQAGLIVSHFLSAFAGVGYMIRRTRVHRRVTKNLSPTRLAVAFARNREFPRHSIVEELSRGLSLQLPILLIATQFGGAVAGFFFLAARLLGTPQLVLANSLLQVSSGFIREDRASGRLYDAASDLAVRTTLLFVLPMLLLGWSAASLSGLVFGSAWAPMAAMIGLLLPWFALRVLATALIPFLHILGRQRTAARVTLLGLGMHIVPLVAALYLNPNLAIAALGFGAGLFYAGIIMFTLRVVAEAEDRPFAKSLILPVSWLGAYVLGYFASTMVGVA